MTILYASIVAGTCPTVEVVQTIAQGIEFQMRASSVAVYYTYEGHATHVIIPVFVTGASIFRIDTLALLKRSRAMQSDVMNVTVFRTNPSYLPRRRVHDNPMAYTTWSVLVILAIIVILI